jgi:hypothetical protein
MLFEVTAFLCPLHTCRMAGQQFRQEREHYFWPANAEDGKTGRP